MAYEVHKHGNQQLMRREIGGHLGDVDSRLSALEARLDALEPRVDTLEQNFAVVGKGTWRFEATNTPPPLSTEVRRNNNPTTTTAIFIHKNDLNEDQSALLSIVAPGDAISLGTGGTLATYAVNNKNDDTDYWTLTVTYSSGAAGTISDGANTPVVFHRPLGVPT